MRALASLSNEKKVGRYTIMKQYGTGKMSLEVSNGK
jgi:hypothetical protein